jgi:serine/threonine protein kinase
MFLFFIISSKVRTLIKSHLNYCSMESVESALKCCELYIYKGDIYSFGCILYELTFLKAAFDNKFELPPTIYNEIKEKREKCQRYSFDLKNLIELTLEEDAKKRPDINQLFNLNSIKERENFDLSGSYCRQVIPHLTINSLFAKQNSLECNKVKLEEFFKPIAMKSLKFNQNLIVILANKHVNTHKVRNGFQYIASTLLSAVARQDDDTSDIGEEAKLFIYTEYGQLLKEFSSYAYETATGSTTTPTRGLYKFNISF